MQLKQGGIYAEKGEDVFIVKGGKGRGV